MPCFALLVLGLLPGQTPVDLIHISDTHVAQLEGAHPELAKARALHRESLGKLNRFIDAANQMPAFTLIHTGDIVDATCLDAATGRAVEGQIAAVSGAFRRLRHPYHLALGNHDVECYRFDPAKPTTPRGDQSVAAQARRQWRKAFPVLRRRTYYAAALAPGYRLIVLDNGHALEARGGRAFFEKQMKWLGRELRQHREQRVILALHIPVADDPKSAMLKARLREAPQTALILCGHRHTNAVDWLDLGPRKILQVRTGALYLGADAWRRIRLYADRLEISAPGQPERVMETVR